LAGAGLLLLGILTGVYLFFPAEALKQRIIQEIETRAGVAVQFVQIEQVSLYPLLNLDARGIELGLTGLPRPLLIEALSIAPQWTTLLSADPGVLVRSSLMNGTITAGLLKSGAISVRAAGLNFDLPIQKPLPFNVTGTLSEAAFDGGTRLDKEAKTLLLLQLADVSVLGLELLKADGSRLALGEITLEAEGQGRSMRVKTLSAKGGDLDVNGDGTLLIGRTSTNSRIKLALQVRPGANADPSITSLLDIFGKPDADGRYFLQVTGTLGNPILKSGG
jgi:type II secretion system protein N